MQIPPSIIITICDITPCTRPQFNGLAMAEAYKNGSFHTRINDNEYFIAFTNNTKQLFYDDEFIGGMITIRKKGENRSSPNLENYRFFVHADAVVISGRPGTTLLSPAGGEWPILFYDNDDVNEVRKQYRYIYGRQYEKNPTEFEMNWGKFIANRPDFHYYTGRFTF